MSSLSRVKVISKTHVYPPINPVADHELLLTGELGVLYGVTFIVSKPLAPRIGDMYNDYDTGVCMVYDGHQWHALGGSEPKLSDFKIACDDAPPMSKASYLKGIKVKSTNHPRLRGETRNIWAIDECAFYDTELTMKKLSALGISPKFLSSESVFDSQKAYSAFNAYIRDVREAQQQVADAVQTELEKLLLTPMGSKVDCELGTTVTKYLTGVLH